MFKKLNIAIICDSIDTTLGGSYISAQRFARGLSEIGHHIVWCTSHFVRPEKKREFGYASLYEFPSLQPLGPQHVRFAYPRVSRLRDIFQKEKIDIVYNIHPSYIGRQAYRAAKKLHLPIISHSHVYVGATFGNLPNFIQKRIKNLIARFYRKCDGVIYPTALAKSDFDEYHFTNKQLVVSNGVDTNFFHPDRKYTNTLFNILFVGRLDPEKRIQMLLEALHVLKLENKLDHHIKCAIVGDGSEEKKLRILTHEYGLGKHVHFTGKITSASPELVKIYQNASVYVLASLFELESMTTLEAMACGCPILIADSKHSAAKFFVNGNGYLFDPFDPKDLAEKLYALISNPNLLETMREKSIQNVAAFSFERSVEKLESFFLSFAKK